MSAAETVKPEVQERVQSVFRAIDEQATEDLLAHFHTDAVQVLGNMPPLVGHDAIREGNRHFYTMIGGLSHEILGIIESGGWVVIRLAVTYTRLDGSTITLPVVTLWTERDGLIDRYEVYFDLAPVFAS